MKLRILMLACGFWTATHAATIVSVTGAPTGGAAAGQLQALTAGFTTGQDYANVSISAVIGGITTQSVTAYLTTQIGPGTTSGLPPAGDEVATITIGLPGGAGALTPIFTGLTLPAGSYYLTLFHETDTAGSWYHSSASIISTAAGASHDFDGYYITNYPMLPLPDYAPAATFAPLMSFDNPPQNSDFLYVVETSEIPEPSTAALITIALAGVTFLRRRAVETRPHL